MSHKSRILVKKYFRGPLPIFWQNLICGVFLVRHRRGAVQMTQHRSMKNWATPYLLNSNSLPRADFFSKPLLKNLFHQYPRLMQPAVNQANDPRGLAIPAGFRRPR
jgi:hypothetical protein